MINQAINELVFTEQGLSPMEQGGRAGGRVSSGLTQLGAVDGSVLVHSLLLLTLPTARPVSMVRGKGSKPLLLPLPREMSWM